MPLHEGSEAKARLKVVNSSSHRGKLGPHRTELLAKTPEANGGSGPPGDREAGQFNVPYVCYSDA
jgi:hypothetical protein